MTSRYLLIWTIVGLSPAMLLAEVTPQVLARGAGANGPKQPQASVFAEGVVDIVYAAGEEIHVTTSRDRGATFAPGTGTLRCPNLAAGMRRGPRIVRSRTAIVVTAIGGEKGKGKDGDLMCWHSTDDGATWSDTVKVNDVPASAREGLHGMMVAENGDVWSVWLDLRSGKTEIYTAMSKDDGQTWSKNILAYRSPGGSVCECCHPSIISEGQASVGVLFRNSISGQRDMFLLGSNDGQKFSAARKLGNGSWTLKACPMDGGMLASDGQDHLITVWRRDDQVFATLGDGQTEKSLGTGQQPWVAWSAAGPILVWTKGREGALSMQVGLHGNARQLAAAARDPVVASNPQCDFSIVCWEAKLGNETTVLTQTLATPAGKNAVRKP